MPQGAWAWQQWSLFQPLHEQGASSSHSMNRDTGASSSPTLNRSISLTENKGLCTYGFISAFAIEGH